jgi:hypothetical protein
MKCDWGEVVTGWGPRKREIDLTTRVRQLEERERERDELLLSYIRSDMASPWMASAKELAAFLDRPLPFERIKK